MNTITLYDHPASIHTQYARICLDEAGVEYQKKFVDLPLGNLKPSFAQISPALSVPALEIRSTGADGTTQSTKLIDSRDIVNYCNDVEGGKRLFPKDKLKDINEILDLVYAANGGQISFKAYPPRDPVFNFAVNKIMAPLRGYKVRGYLANSRHSPRLTKAYEDALVRLDRPGGPSMEELSERANKAMSVLDEKLKEGPWLLGAERTAADLVAAVWVQWIVWANVSSIAVPPRVILSGAIQGDGLVEEDCTGVGDSLRSTENIRRNNLDGMRSCWDGVPCCEESESLGVATGMACLVAKKVSYSLPQGRLGFDGGSGTLTKVQTRGENKDQMESDLRLLAFN